MNHVERNRRKKESHSIKEVKQGVGTVSKGMKRNVKTLPPTTLVYYNKKEEVKTWNVEHELQVKVTFQLLLLLIVSVLIAASVLLLMS